MSYIEINDLSSWEEYVSIHEGCDLSQYIFRGHSNVITDQGFLEWKLLSSFNRFYTTRHSYAFTVFIQQQLEFFEHKYREYFYSDIAKLTNLSKLEKCYYLQHYGIPTCLIDFTYDPLVALYFALSQIQGTSSLQYDGNDICTHFSTKPNEDFVTIYRLNHKLLNQCFNIKTVTEENFDDTLAEYEFRYGKYILNQVKLALILHPAKREENFNLSKQKGCFLLFDNCNPQNMQLQKRDLLSVFEEHQSSIKSIDIPEPVITVFKIKYNSLMNKLHRSPSDISAFEFLKRKNITGKTLFNDIQGLKYDFNFFHSR